MQGKSRSGKSKSARARKSRVPRPPASAPLPPPAATVVAPGGTARPPQVMLRRKGVSTTLDLPAATAARYPYVTAELKQVGIFTAGIVVLLLILFFALS